MDSRLVLDVASASRLESSLDFAAATDSWTDARLEDFMAMSSARSLLMRVVFLRRVTFVEIGGFEDKSEDEELLSSRVTVVDEVEEVADAELSNSCLVAEARPPAERLRYSESLTRFESEDVDFFLSREFVHVSRSTEPARRLRIFSASISASMSMLLRR